MHIDAELSKSLLSIEISIPEGISIEGKGKISTPSIVYGIMEKKGGSL
jgi:hypothetical protein